MLPRVLPHAVEAANISPVDAPTLAAAKAILDDVRDHGEPALRAHAVRLGDVQPDAPLVLGRDDLAAAARALPAGDLALLERTASRIRAFADAQRAAFADIDVAVPGGRAGHALSPVDRAGCYAPGGRYPLPSSVLMTAVTARAAGVAEVWVASPRPALVTLAAAWVAGADALLTVGGAHAVGALAYGAGSVPRVDVIVGPGNRWVTAAKQLVAGQVGIDMLAGPSELVVLADASADPARIAADLLGQAEHDPDARPILVTWDPSLPDRVDAALARALETLPTALVARQAVANGFSVLCADVDEAIAVCDRLAPEHLEVLTVDAETVAARLRHYGGLFVGAGSAEVFGDYGVGPNHVLPTGTAARFSGGLNVLHFLRVRTWLRMDAGSPVLEPLIDDAAALARLEGLEAHARSAEARRG
jgi:phosphoribosyl-ATP pyrophosphohydrolase/phosphoribosyl-AMP cyclohydrolase/histidinol dehydrogenase